MDQYDALMTWYSKVLQLRRLLHCMVAFPSQPQEEGQKQQQEYSLTILRQDFETNQYRIIQQQQIIEAQSMFGNISREAEFLMHHAETTQDQYHEILDILQDLSVSVEHACTLVQQNLVGAVAVAVVDASHNTNNNNDNNNNNNNNNNHNMQTRDKKENHSLFDLDSAARFINHVFYDVDDDDYDNKDVNGYDHDDDNDNNDDILLEEHEDDTSSTFHISPCLDTDTRDEIPFITRSNKAPTHTFAIQQCPEEEILQEEISNMAAQLKQSSLQIKSTLASQNKNLQNIEMLAQENLNKTSQVAQNVTQHVSAGWKRSFRKWFVFFMILGTWFFCFLTIRMIPKRKGVCLWFYCDKSSTSTSNNDDGQEEVSDDDMLHAKYSYCHEYSIKTGSNDNNHGTKQFKKKKQCTMPRHAPDHTQSMEKLFNTASSSTSSLAFGTTPEDIAERIAQEIKGKRMENHHERAKQEDDKIAAGRITEGWKSSNVMIKGIEEETRQKSNNENQSTDVVKYSRDDVKRAILQNDLTVLQTIMASNPELATLRDENGWEVLHEAVRKGSVEAAAILLNTGYANIDAQVGASGQGGSVLWIAKRLHGDNHDVIQYLMDRGATEIPPGRRKTEEL
eukprot:CAMPEP_0176506166 /NCGR_PEP_ID=MMETSP0200_2-20121128/16887_1 /TAXON_ID=947934 /ORGANISM="Chaetoceros sp., Strain GSL56" /LENGTH=620 /DNA_ID=CAMNT_0017905777 /DNA_START=974 /DNA_END=2836 /DNA_ORIENTATION=-